MFWWILGGLFLAIVIATLVFAFDLAVAIIKTILLGIVRLVELVWIGVGTLVGRKVERNPQEWATGPIEPTVTNTGPRTYEDDEIVYTKAPPPMF